MSKLLFDANKIAPQQPLDPVPAMRMARFLLLLPLDMHMSLASVVLGARLLGMSQRCHSLRK